MDRSLWHLFGVFLIVAGGAGLFFSFGGSPIGIVLIVVGIVIVAIVRVLGDDPGERIVPSYDDESTREKEERMQRGYEQIAWDMKRSDEDAKERQEEKERRDNDDD